MCNQKIFSPENINVLLSTKQTGIKWEQGQISTTWKEIGLINTKLSKLTKWEMYGRQKNSYGSLVSGRVNTKLTIYYKCIQTVNLKTSMLLDSVLVNFNKERRNENWKVSLRKAGSLRYITLPGSQHSMSFCENKNQKNAITKHQYLKTWKILAGLGFDKH